MANPSILSSVSQLTGRRHPARCAPATPARSSAEKTLSRLSRRSACSTAANPVANPPPTRWLGDSGVTQRGVLGLQRLQFLQQRVELAVGHRRRVQHVVAELGVRDDLRRARRAARRRRRGRPPKACRAARRPPRRWLRSRRSHPVDRWRPARRCRTACWSGSPRQPRTGTRQPAGGGCARIAAAGARVARPRGRWEGGPRHPRYRRRTTQTSITGPTHRVRRGEPTCAWD